MFCQRVTLVVRVTSVTHATTRERATMLTLTLDTLTARTRYTFFSR